MNSTTIPAPIKKRPSYRFGVQTRLVIFIMLVTVPLLIGITAYLSSQAGNQIEAQALYQMQQSNTSLSTIVTTWLEYNRRILQEMATMPDIISQNPNRQEPVLVAFSSVHPGLYLAHTIGLDGINIARNDRGALLNYGDRSYFVAATSGNPFAYEILIGRTSGRPALVMASPVYDATGKVTSVVSIARELDEITREVVQEDVEQQIAFIVDERNFVIAHPDPKFTTGGELFEMSKYPPVEAMRQGQKGIIAFTDETGREWSAYINLLENGWGIIVQRPQDVLFAPVRQFQNTSTVLIIFGALTMLILAWFTVRQSLRPIAVLTAAASAISAGDFNRHADIKSEDEFGLLADTFNEMTTRLRESINILEQRVADRTKALETSFEVSRRLSTILDQTTLAREVVEQVQSAFNYYHAHIYFFDEQHENLVMAGGTGEAGAAMLVSGHKIPKGRGLVGRAAESNESVLVPDVSQSIGWLPNPLLPDTKAEVAVPIASGDQVLGVLDVQHNIVDGLGQDDVTLLQSLAGQIAISLQNARAYEQSRAQAELESMVNTIGQKIQRAGTLEETLQIAIREIGTLVGATRVAGMLSPAKSIENEENQ